MTIKVSMKVNGKPVSADVEARTLLVPIFRENLRLTGTHVGCDTAQCGACTVLMNGRAIKSCSIVAVQAEGADIMTIEGVAKPDGTLHPMQAAFKENHGLQCGFCTPGMVMNALDFAQSHPNPTEQEVREARGQPLPLHRLPQHRQGASWPAPRAMGGQDTNAPPHRRARPAQGGLPRFLTGAGQYTDDVALPTRPTRLPALAARARHDQHRSISKKQKAPRRRRGLHRRRPGRGQGRRPAVRLADHRCQRQADEGAAASGARAGQGAPRRRPGRGGGRRDARPGEGRGRADRGRLRGAAGGGRSPRGASRARRDPRHGPDNTLLRLGARRQGAVDAAFAKAAHVTKLDFCQQPPGAQRDRAARGVAPYSRADELHALRREPEPARRAPADDRVRARPARAQGAW